MVEAKKTVDRFNEYKFFSCFLMIERTKYGDVFLDIGSAHSEFYLGYFGGSSASGHLVCYIVEVMS